jgi:hypothetical protein
MGIAMLLAMPTHAATDPAARAAVAPSAAPEINGGDRSLQTLRGVVAAIDERNDLITVRLRSDSVTSLKVNDGLLFNALRYGDEIEVTVRNIDGARTIVGLMKQ